MNRPAGEIPFKAEFHWAIFEREMRRERKFVTLRDELVRAGVELVEIVDEALAVIQDSPSRAQDLLTTAFEDAAGHSEVSAVLAVYLYARSLAVWELSSDWDQVRAIISATKMAADSACEILSSRDPVETDLVHLITELLGSIDQAMQVENGLNCSCPVEMEIAAEYVVEQAQGVLKSLSQLPRTSHPGCWNFVESRALVDETYFNAIGRVADGAKAYNAGSPDASEALVEAIADVLQAEHSEFLDGDVYESELRSHRLGLQGMIDASPRRLYVNEAKIIYCYPFALAGRDGNAAPRRRTSPADFVVAARTYGALWAVDGVKPEVRELTLSDMWDGAAGEKNRFGGVAIALEAATVSTAAGETLEGYEIELRLSQFGNHYLRVHRWLKDATLHQLHQHIRRGTSQMGEEEVIFGGKPFPRLSDLACHLIEAFVAHLDLYIESSTELVPFAHEASQHVIVAARQLSVQKPDRTRVDASIDQVRGAAGASLILQPVRIAAATLEEWVRYPVPDIDESNFLKGYGFVGDFAVRTTNTTFALLRGLPEFLIVEYEEGAEFVASVPALLQSCLAEIRDAKIDYEIDSSTVKEINEQQLELRKTVTEARTILAKIRSPELCLTAVHRELLDRMLDRAGVPLLENEVRKQFEILDAHYAELATVQARRDEERSNRLLIYLGAAAALLAIPSLAGVLGLLDTGLNIGGVSDTAEGLSLVGLLAILAIVVRLQLTPTKRGNARQSDHRRTRNPKGSRGGFEQRLDDG
jgi:hypothetical protein